jgi:hypothetical protein
MRIEARIPIAALAAAFLLVPAARGVGTRLDASALATRARDVPVGESVRIEGLRDASTGRLETISARRFEVFSPDARIVVVGTGGPRETRPPANVYFRGELEGAPGSRAALSVLANGTVRGLVLADDAIRMITTGPAGPEIHRVSAAELEHPVPFECDGGLDVPGGGAARVRRLLESPFAEPSFLPPAHTARVAVETDYEFFQRFAGDTEEIDYAADLIAYESAFAYEPEIGTSLEIPHMRVWTTPADPWTEASPICNLFQFGKNWNDTQGAVTRTIVHMMSGKSNGGGVAWVGVLCSGPFNYNTSGSGCSFSNTSNYGGGYGYTGAMSGNFDPQNPGILWDLVATAHEMGHNFSSPHSHCYGGIGGNGNPIDGCYNGECGGSGCYCGTVGYPGIGTLTGGSQGQHGGTIMSYCHLRAGGFTNVAFSFGTGHPYGVAADREASQMLAGVASAAAGHPGCLDFDPQSLGLFSDGFEIGSTANWSATQP